MHTVQISERVKEVIERHVAEGAAGSEAEFLEAAVRYYSDEIAEDDTDALLAAAQEGIEASARGDFVTINTPEEQEAVWGRIWNRAMELAAEIRAGQGPQDTDASR